MNKKWNYPTREEIEDTIRNLQNNKSRGATGITAGKPISTRFFVVTNSQDYKYLEN